MSRVRALKQQSEDIEDMRDIVTALKTLAFFETQKLSRYLVDQGKAVGSIRLAASDFLTFYPFEPTNTYTGTALVIAVGADRGFCGNFNDEIIEATLREVARGEDGGLEIIAVGDRLSSKLAPRLQNIPINTIQGATLTEEAPAVLEQVVELVSRQMAIHHRDFVKVKIIAHQYGKDQVEAFEPLTELITQRAPYGSPPDLTLSPGKFFRLLIRQYLELVLWNVFYSSLMAENTRRIMHLDAALRRLESDTVGLKRKYNRARQEEITEEIEILLMNAGQGGER